MRWPGFSELLRRLVTLVLVCLAFAMTGYWPLWAVGLIALAGVAAYILFPRPRPPDGALTYEKAPSQTVPDWLGFVMVGVFFALPIWAARSDPWGGAIHPAAVLTWPLALFSNAFWLIGAAYAAYWIKLEPERLTIHAFTAEHDIGFDEIRAVTPYTKDLPVWIRALSPALVATGNFGAAGAITLARPRRGITLELKTGKPVAIAADSLPKGIHAIETALAAHGLTIGTKT